MKALLLFFFTFSCALLANNEIDDFIDDIIPKTSLSNDQLRFLREELRIQKIIIEEVQGLKNKGVNITNLNSPNSNRKIQEMLLRSFEAKSSTVTGEIKDVIKQGFKQDNLKKALEDFKSFLKKTIHSKKSAAASLIRQYGLEVGLIYMASVQIDVTLPLIMIGQGHLGYSVLLATPVSSIVTGSYIAIKNAVKFNQIIKSFGSINKAFDHYKHYFKIKNFFNENIFRKVDLIDVTIGHNNYVITSARENLISKAMTKLGFNKGLNYQNILKVLEKENLMSDFLYAVKSTNPPESIKLLRIINRISLTQDEKVMRVLAEHFSNDIKSVTALNDFPHLKKWAVEISHSTSIKSFIHKLANMPTDVPPKVMDRLWRSYIIPTSSKNITPFISRKIFKSFNKLSVNYNRSLFGEMAQSLELEISPLLHKKFIDYLYNSLSEVNICQGLFRQKGSKRLLLIQY